MDFEHLVERAGQLIELVGVAITVVGVLLALAVFFRDAVRSDDRVAAYQTARRNVGRTVLLGLEVLVAGDIIRTVGLDPSFTSVGVLAGIVAIRTFLSFTIETEITGRLPWQDAPSGQDR